jgi:hypothetical protein
MRGFSSDAVVVTSALLAVALIQCAMPPPVADAAASSVGHHRNRARPSRPRMAADQPRNASNAADAAADEYDGNNYDDEDYDENGVNSKRPTTTSTPDLRTTCCVLY